MRSVTFVCQSENTVALTKAILDEAYHVRVYSNCAQALASLSRDNPHAFIVDTSVPDLRIEALMDALERRKPKASCPRIALIPETTPPHIKKLIPTSFHGAVGLPLTDHQLLVDVIERVVAFASGS